jgi:hypothetical protein
MDDLYEPLDEKKRKLTKKPSSEKSLRDWFGRKGAPGKKGGWVDCNTCRKGKCKPCGRSKGEKRSKYPRCRPTPSACKGYKSKKSKKNEELYMDLEQIIVEEFEKVIDEKKKRKKKKKKSKGKKDACYHKVKSRYKVWPSAYASGALSKCRKVGAKNWGNSKKEQVYAMIEDELVQVLLESHTKEHEEELKTIVGELEKASKMHAGQAERIQQIIDETDDDKLKEGEKKNCGCGQDPCMTYGVQEQKQELEEDCQDGYERVPGSVEFARGSCRKKTNEDINIEDIIREELKTVLAEKKKKKACKPSKGKRFAKRVNGKCRSFGQKGQAKGGGDRIRPGTKKGDAYCARSAKIKKCKNPPCANDLSRKKWKCRGSKSMKEAIKKVNEIKNVK